MSLTLNVHATGRYSPVSFKVEVLDSIDDTIMLTIKHNLEEGPVQVMLSLATATSLLSCLAGYLGLQVGALVKEDHSEALIAIARLIPHDIIERV